MSSDSEDDFSYTNSASMLKALKKDISITEEKNVALPVELEDSIKNEDNNADIIVLSNLDDNVYDSPVKNSQSILDISSTVDIIDEDVSNKNDSCIMLSDEDLLSSPANLISKIDNALVREKRATRSKTRGRGRGRGRKNISTRTTRQSTRRSNNFDALPSALVKDYYDINKINDNDIQEANYEPRGRKGISRRTTRRSTRRLNNFDVLPATLAKDYNKPDISIIDDNDLQEANYEVRVKVMWMSQYLQKFSIRRFDKVQTIFKYFSERENIPENKLIFTIEKDAVILSNNDTPDSLNINAATIIEGGVRTDKNQSNIINKPDKDGIEIKIQFKDKKRPMIFTIRTIDRMEVLMHKTAAELDVDVNNLKFYLDGDLITSSDTVNDLQLEGGECIDCIKYN